MSRRLRVTLAFTALLAVALATAGALIHLRFARDLHRSQDRGLRAAVAALADAAERGGAAGTLPGGAGPAADEDVAQVVRPDGTVLAASAEGPVPLTTPAVRAAALRGPVLADRPGDARLDEGLRLAAVPVRVGGRPAVAVVGASSDEVHEAVVTLGRVEAVGLGAALLVGALGAWLLAGAVVRPVREALARERRFVADASHELRTPLTVLKAELEVGRMEGGDAEALRAVLRSAEEEVDRLSRLAGDLLVLARADAGGLVLRRGDVAVDEVLARAARGRDGVVVVPSGLRVTGDDLRLEQAVGNLIDNALRHGAPPVEVGARREDGVVRIVVRDHGAGIPPDFLPRATERFSRPDGARAGGSGLGLAIVAAVARAHGGEVRLRSDGRETVAELELPTTPAKFG